jgi:hypothetical protein
MENSNFVPSTPVAWAEIGRDHSRANGAEEPGSTTTSQEPWGCSKNWRGTEIFSTQNVPAMVPTLFTVTVITPESPGVTSPKSISLLVFSSTFRPKSNEAAETATLVLDVTPSEAWDSINPQVTRAISKIETGTRILFITIELYS